MSYLAELERLRVLGPLDVHLARTLGRLGGEEDPRVLLGAALASRAVSRGHVCADLPALCRGALLDRDDNPVAVELPAAGGWLDALGRSPLVARGVGEGRPLVLDGRRRLYLHRYAAYQERLARNIQARAEVVHELDEQVEAAIDRLFEAGAIEQRQAARTAAGHRFSVISGGPGTGKTTTVVKVLALLQEQARAAGRWPLRIALVAPTGKAAARLGEAIAGQLASLRCDESIKRSIPTSASTIHRLLGYRPHTPTSFRHGRDDPIAKDVLLADEASMIDLALMTKLLDALLSEARVILLGDKDQLASVEAGAILGDIYAGAARGALAGCTAELSRSYRFGDDSAIGTLARAINTGDAGAALRELELDRGLPFGDALLVDIDQDRPLEGALGVAIREGFAPLCEAATPAERLAALDRFRLLCVHRRGPLGVEAMNRLVEQHLGVSGDAPYYDGRPIMVTRNDYQLGVFNGDIGVVSVDAGGSARASFAQADGSLRSIPTSRLPPHETVYAMTVHKSQGSEVDKVALLLPPRASPILTRELLYTGVTRARQTVDVYGTEEQVRAAIARRIERASGLQELLVEGS